MDSKVAVLSALKPSKTLRQRFRLQLATVIVHIFIIKFTVPNIWWALFGLAFWTAVILWAARSGRWVCANFCWLGGVQDWLEPIAKKRVSFNPKISQYLVLFVLVIWTPLVWLFTDTM
ncbi:MAG: 4Fe-4S binding protein, partial [Candidatus Thermochlorobacter sp.]